jgi:dimethylaniline monooxygenase (N-oxide forming)
MTTERVAIIGGGMSGVAAARYLKSQGFAPVVFEAHSDLGGQWNIGNEFSGVWPSLRTNTAGFATRFSDVDYPPQVSIFPRHGEVLDMIRAMVAEAGLSDAFVFGAKVTGLERDGAGYHVRWEQSGETHSARFERAVVASGRFNKPEVPAVEGLDRFSGRGGVIHSLHYKDPWALRDMNILVLGGSISSLEVASDQAMMGKGRVYLAQRRQRYVMPKMIAGVPLEFFVFTLEGALALDNAKKDELLAGAKEFLELNGGNPSRYGAPAPDEDMEKAGVTGSQHYLNLVAEDRIDVRPWVARIDGTTVHFTDDSTAEVDAIVIGTGFDLHLPFLSDEIARTVNLTRKGIDLHQFTFHPDLPNLAFAGLWAQLGPYAVPLEQQARWIAYAWGDAAPMPGVAEQRAGVEASRLEGHHVGYREQHEMAVRFARLAGTMPDARGDRELALILPKSPVTGDLFRISGPDARPGAADKVKALFWNYAAIPLKREIAASLKATGTKEEMV